MPRSASLILLLGLLLSGPAAGTPPAGAPGSVDLADLGFDPAQTPTADVSYARADLARAAGALAGSEPVLAALLRSLRSFRLLQFSDPTAATATDAQTLLASLPAGGWLRVLLDTQGTRQVSVYVRPDTPGLDAFLVIAVDPAEEVSVAVAAGNIDPAQLVLLGLPIP